VRLRRADKSNLDDPSGTHVNSVLKHHQTQILCEVR
jgi:hypothetical protein